MIPYIILGVLGAALTLVLHEFSHALAAWANGCKVTGFYPWPHMHEGHFYFGRMTYDYEGLPPNRRWFTLAPLLKAVPLFLLWGGLGFLWHPLWCLGFWEATDWINWLQGFIRKSKNDGGQFRAELASTTAPIA